MTGGVGEGAVVGGCGEFGEYLKTKYCHEGYEVLICLLCKHTYIHTYISRYHGKCGISLWVIRYIPTV